MCPSDTSNKPNRHHRPQGVSPSDCSWPAGWRPVALHLAFELAVFAALAAAIITTHARTAGVAFAAVAGVAVGVLLAWHSRRDVLFFLVVAVAGTAAELVFVRFGVWHYAHPAHFGIPAWFPIAFGSAAVIGARMVATVESIGRGRQSR